MEMVVYGVTREPLFDQYDTDDKGEDIGSSGYGPILFFLIRGN